MEERDAELDVDDRDADREKRYGEGGGEKGEDGERDRDEEEKRRPEQVERACEEAHLEETEAYGRDGGGAVMALCSLTSSRWLACERRGHQVHSRQAGTFPQSHLPRTPSSSSTGATTLQPDKSSRRILRTILPEWYSSSRHNNNTKVH